MLGPHTVDRYESVEIPSHCATHNLQALCGRPCGIRPALKIVVQGCHGLYIRGQVVVHWRHRGSQRPTYRYFCHPCIVSGGLYKLTLAHAKGERREGVHLTEYSRCQIVIQFVHTTD